MTFPHTLQTLNKHIYRRILPIQGIVTESGNFHYAYDFITMNVSRTQFFFLILCFEHNL